MNEYMCKFGSVDRKQRGIALWLLISKPLWLIVIVIFLSQVAALIFSKLSVAVFYEFDKPL